MNFDEQLHELIALRALELSRLHSTSGNPAEDWLRAEQEIMHELNLRSDELFKEMDMRDMWNHR